MRGRPTPPSTRARAPVAAAGVALTGALIAGLLGTGAEAAAEVGWPQYRGVNRDGVAVGDVAVAPWGEAGPRVVWRRAIGEAFSAVSVAGDRLFTLFAEGDREYAAAFDAGNGEELWRREVGERFEEEFGDGPRSTPTVAGERLFVLGGRGRLAALAAADGSPLWQVELSEAFGTSLPIRGFATSALVDGDQVVVQVGGGEGKAYAAFDAASGTLRWAAADGGAGYTSPVAATVNDARQYVGVGRDEVLALSASGEVLWTHPWLPGTIAMPLFIAPDKVFVSASYDVGAALLEIAAGEGGFQVREIWRNRSMKNHFSSSVHHQGHVYGFDNATLKCLSLADGATRWARRGHGKGSLILLGGDLLVLSDRGRLALVEATPDGYREKASFQALDGKSWTAPAFSGGRLYLRNLQEMVSLDLAAPAAAEAP